MGTVEYVVRDAAGSVRSGTFPEGNPATVYVSYTKDVSLNLNSAEIASYERTGDDLTVTLANGEVLVLAGYFDEGATGPKNLFLSENGELIEVFLGDADQGVIAVDYAALDTSGKWSAYDDLVFLDLGRIEPVVAPLAAPLVSPWLLGAGAGAAALAGGGGGDDGGGGGPIVPTVDDPDSTQEIGGNGSTTPTVTGTGTPGSTVDVTIGDQTVTTTVLDDGTWQAEFDVLPEDGVYEATVHVEDPDGNTWDLDAPTMDIDTTPPLIAIQDVEGDNVINLVEASDGVTLQGVGEAGASVTVEFQGLTRTTTVDAEGNWSFDFAASEITGGTYDADIVLTSTDARGNSTTFTHTVHIDTEQALTLNATVGGDLVINGDEAAAGVTFTGTSQPGSSVEVTMGGITHTVVASATGSYSVTFASYEITDGTYDATVTAVATDTAGNVETTSQTVHVDTETTVSVDPGQAGGDDVINQEEAAAGITLTGMAEPGSSVTVTVAGVSRAATVAADGSWTAIFGAGTIPAGEYDTTVTAVSKDAAGNTATSTANIRVDTVAGDVALSSLPIEIDDVINAVERADGVDIHGTATPGLAVTVMLGDATQIVTADASGNWTAGFASYQIPTGTETLPISASITDDAGNSKTVTDSVQLDTQVDNFTQTTTPVAGDDVINSSEAAGGVSLNGTVEPGSTVSVQLGGTTLPASVDAAGNWSVTFLPGSIPGGTYDTNITITATDRAGNVDTLTDTVRVDTEVSVASDANQTADDTLNAVEHAAGVTLEGSADPGSTVMVELLGTTRAATVDGAGNWSAHFTAAEIPEGTYTASATITATDAAGNSASVTETFGVDTEIATPNVDSVTFSGEDVRRISTEDSIDSYTVNTLEPGGSVGTPAASVSSDPTFGTEFTFASPVPDGTNLVVTRTDDAGNSASTLVVTDDDAGNATTVGHAGISGFDIAALNLEYGDDTSLTLTEAQIKAMSNSTDELTIHGGTDDTITVSGAVNTGDTRMIDGQTYNVYTIGDDGATLVVEQDVTVII